MYDHIYTETADIERLTSELDSTRALPPLSAFVDGRGLRCPMPLLKVKISLKSMISGTIYAIANDKNSMTDITAFCQKNGLALETWQSSIDLTDTIFHFLITKNG